MFWNKIPKGYVETVDGYLIKESEAKRVTIERERIKKTVAPVCLWEKYETDIFFRKDNAPNYDYKDCNARVFKKMVEVEYEGTPIGYHTQEEVQKLKDRIKELEDKLRIARGDYHSGDIIAVCDSEPTIKQITYKDLVEGFKTKNKRGRPKKK